MIEKQEQISESENDGRSENENVALQKIKEEIHRKLLEVLDLNEARKIPIEQLHQECSNRVDALLSARQYPLSG
ncbi:MAG: hypothetical protein WBC05_12215, partial [Sedimentisphaerales bacterium]